MKKASISLFLLTIICLTLLSGCNSQSSSVEYLRIHIRANSNSEVDQNVKYLVKAEVVEYLTPYISECKSKETAVKTLLSQKENIEKVCDKVLENNGFNYKSKVAVRNELFPTRVYGEFTLDEGFYDALIVELGKAKGDNWWCVVYPPLCFAGNNSNVVYKSKILEIINAFKSKISST